MKNILIKTSPSQCIPLVMDKTQHNEVVISSSIGGGELQQEVLRFLNLTQEQLQ